MSQPPKYRSTFPRFLIAILALFIAAASCDPSVVGITCLVVTPDGFVIAPQQTGSNFVSEDGGLTWAGMQGGGAYTDLIDERCYFYQTIRGNSIVHGNYLSVSDPYNLQIVYRGKPKLSIERSDDGGKTWQTDLYVGGAEANTEYFIKVQHGDYPLYETRTGPMDMVIEPQTGNLIVAMVYEGVLVRTPEGEWLSVAVGPYEPIRLNTFESIFPLIRGELQFAVFFALVVLISLPLVASTALIGKVMVSAGCSLLTMGAFLWVALIASEDLPFEWTGIILGMAVLIGLGVVFLTARLLHRHDPKLLIAVTLSWLLLVPAPQADFSHSVGADFLKMLAVVAAILIPVIALVIAYLYFPRRIVFILGLLGSAFLWIFVDAGLFYLWATGIIPYYWTSGMIAAGLCVSALVAGHLAARRWLKPSSPTVQEA